MGRLIASVLAIGLMAVIAARPGEAVAGDEEEIFESVGKLECAPEKKWRWWVLIFSRAYSDCLFAPAEGEDESYRGRSGIRFGGDLQRTSFEFDVQVKRRPKPARLQPGELAGEYRGTKLAPSADKAVALTGGDFRLAPVFTGRAFGWIYLYLEPKPATAPGD